MRCSSIGAMDATELDAVLTDSGVSPAIASQLVGDGWNLKNFRTVVSDVSELNMFGISFLLKPCHWYRKLALELRGDIYRFHQRPL